MEADAGTGTAVLADAGGAAGAGRDREAEARGAAEAEAEAGVTSRFAKLVCFLPGFLVFFAVADLDLDFRNAVGA